MFTIAKAKVKPKSNYMCPESGLPTSEYIEITKAEDSV